ncbi:Endonuclease IV [Dehalobacter sp. UNSWDHB]|jgi:Endonuclease IV|uniref:TIM barrel protein n=1 Tax=unclassified Dehalobacter TaxID=2635733 RepID=UPI00028BA5F9|nr:MULTISPECIES: TIM barrel protein [unclassified Dehalobacter]AFV03133.1 Endonuclease IV [Dehalobacter sp. DCA]AFV06122.1 Endonuclease IV [Dehalobacter sp. CF]EQB21104.1 Endonuclease IV [Dehalobacter sp. UNSWDHB]
MSIKFGTAGVPLSSKEASTEAGILRIRELGMDAMEVEFVHGVRMKEDKALKTGGTAKKERVSLSCHAPYYINLNSSETEKVEASKTRIMHTARIARILGAGSIVFHPAFYSGDTSDTVLARVVKELSDVRQELDQEGNQVILRPETTGKPSQFGDLGETIKIAQEVPGVLPCIDFSHLHARANGQFNSYDEFCAILEQTAEGLGEKWTSNAHFHISGIEYGPKGEKRHLVLQEADLKYREILKACLSFGIQGTVICESPKLEEDALILQKTYQELKAEH